MNKTTNHSGEKIPDQYIKSVKLLVFLYCAVSVVFAFFYLQGIYLPSLTSVYYPYLHFVENLSQQVRYVLVIIVLFVILCDAPGLKLILPLLIGSLVINCSIEIYVEFDQFRQMTETDVAASLLGKSIISILIRHLIPVLYLTVCLFLYNSSIMKSEKN